MTAEQYRAVGPYIALAGYLGTFASWAAVGNPKTVRLVYRGKIADQNTVLVRNAGIAGVLSRSMSHKANVVNALQYAADRGLAFAERHEPKGGDLTDTIRLELETDLGVSTVEGAVVMDHPRILQVDGIRCEARLEGHLLFLKTDDVPGVIGYVGGVLGQHKINIANFSFGRQDATAVVSGHAQSISMLETDSPVPEAVLKQLLENKAVKLARVVEFG
jgi:D-3-phosphoglycerate dehydrogenase